MFPATCRWALQDSSSFSQQGLLILDSPFEAYRRRSTRVHVTATGQGRRNNSNLRNRLQPSHTKDSCNGVLEDQVQNGPKMNCPKTWTSRCSFEPGWDSFEQLCVFRRKDALRVVCIEPSEELERNPRWKFSC